MNYMAVTIDYTNWRGARRFRRIQPVEIIYTSSKWHEEEQWQLIAIDLEDKNHLEKGFALKDIHSWTV